MVGWVLAPILPGTEHPLQLCVLLTPAEALGAQG